jgi:hypothetical protein
MPPLPAAEAAPDVRNSGRPGSGTSFGVRVASAALPEGPVSMLLVETSVNVPVQTGAKGFASKTATVSRAGACPVKAGGALGAGALVDVAGAELEVPALCVSSKCVVFAHVRLPAVRVGAGDE